MRLRYDREADALYIHITEDAPVSRTEEIDPGTLVDLDQHGGLVGVELIRPARSWPIEDILSRFQINDEDAVLLRALWQQGTRYPLNPAELVVA